MALLLVFSFLYLLVKYILVFSFLYLLVKHISLTRQDKILMAEGEVRMVYYLLSSNCLVFAPKRMCAGVVTGK